MVLLLTFIAASVCALLFGRVSSLSINKLNYFSFLYYYNILLLCFLGVVFIIFGWSHDDVLNLVASDTRFYASLYIVCGLSLFSLCVFLFSNLLGVNRKSLDSFISAEVFGSKFIVRIWFVFIFLVAVISAFLFFSNIKIIPIFQIIKGGLDVATSAKLRTDSVFDLGPILYFVKMTATPLTQIVYFFFLAEFLRQKKFFYGFLTLASFALAVLFLTYGGDKAPVAIFLLGHVFFFVLVNGRVSFRFLAFALSVSFMVIIYLYSSTMFGLSDSLLISFVNRLFVSQISGTYLAFQHYDTVEPFIHFSSQNASILTLVGGEPSLRASERLVEFYFTDSYRAGTFKNINSMFLHEAWANFGLVGAFLSPIWVALLLSLNFYIIFSFKKTSSTVAFLTYFTYDTVSFSTSFNAYVFSVQYFVMLAFFLVCIFLEQISTRVKRLGS